MKSRGGRNNRNALRSSQGMDIRVLLLKRPFRRQVYGRVRIVLCREGSSIGDISKKGGARGSYSVNDRNPRLPANLISSMKKMHDLYMKVDFKKK